MSQTDTRCLANVGLDAKADANDGFQGGNQGYTGKYYIFSYRISGTDAALTNAPIGVAPCNCRYVGTSVWVGSGTAGTFSVTFSPKKAPFDAGTTVVALNTTDAVLGTTVVAFPAMTSTIDFDDGGPVVAHGSNNTAVATGIVDAVLATGAAAAFRQGDAVVLTTTGTFTGSGNVYVSVILREQNGVPS